MKTSVTEYLDDIGVEYTVKTHSQPALTCEVAAQERGVRVSQIVKCMVGDTDGGDLVVMLLPGDRTLKSSRARKFLGVQALNLVDPNRLADELGLTVGAISPIQLIGKSTILMDPTVLDEEIVDISSGDPLAGVELASADLRDILDAQMTEIISKN